MNHRLTALSAALGALLLAQATVAAVDPAAATQRQFLSGHGKDDAVPWKFFCTAGAQSGFWTNLPVPSNWEMRGFGTLSYQYDPTNTPPEQGRYEHDFTVPPDWSGCRVFLVFDGAMTDTRASVNGQSAGPLHQGSFYRFRYDITKLLRFGASNRLEVTVDKRSANAGVNRAERRGDYWLFGGIFRPVFLEAVPQDFIERVAIDARADGAFALDVFAPAVAADRAGLEVVAQITTLDGQPVGAAFTQPLVGGSASLKTLVAAPRQWTAETPELYFVEVGLRRGGKVLHQIQQRFGFRTMEVRDGDGLYVNGRRVILQGANRHSFWPDSGRTLSEAVHQQDIALMKEMNMNAVRMSHYPPDEQFLDLCDELGLYVLDELAGWQGCYDTEVGRRLVEEMVIRDVNHPSILFWDNGNEGGWNNDLNGDFARWDPQSRRVLHPWETFSGVNTAHYRNFAAAAKICAGRNIYLPTEFLHGLYDGGAGAGLEDYWEMMRASKIIGGGFIWALLDEGVKRPDTGKLDVTGNRAPDGLLGPYREKEGSFFTVKELWSPLVITERTLPEDFSGTLTLENRYSFTDARQCGFQWHLRQFALPSAAAAGFTVIAKGAAAPPSIAPASKGALKLDLPAGWQNADALALTASDPTGQVLWTWVWPLPGANRFRAAVAAPAARSATAIETADVIAVAAGSLGVHFSKATGQLLSVHRGKQKFSLANGPRPAAGEAKLTSLEQRADGTDQLVSATYTGALQSVTWRVRGNGWVTCDYAFAADGPQDVAGVVFDYPEALVKGKRWLGDGPYRVWKNRLRGVTLGVWENTFNNTITGWSGWEYPEFKGCFANVRWLRLDTTEGLLTALPGSEIPFVQVLTPEFPPTKLQMKTALSLPTAGLAFLHSIPATGSKFETAKNSGPQGTPNELHGTYRGSVDFHFGALP